MAKLTKELRDRCVFDLRGYAAMGDPGASRNADALAACEVEEETVTKPERVRWALAYHSLIDAGWQFERSRDDWSYLFTKGDRCCYMWHSESNSGGHVTKTLYCPPDLLEGRLKALEVAE